MKNRVKKIPLAAFFFSLFGCQSTPPLAPLKTVAHVDIPRFMGKWYVLAIIPNFIEKNCYASTETYTLRDDGDIHVLFECRKDSFEGKEFSMTQHGWVKNKETNAEWRVRPLWPLSFAYLIIDLANDYGYTVIGYPSRDLVWVMAREKTLPENTWVGINARLQAQGYDLSKIVRIPQQ